MIASDGLALATRGLQKQYGSRVALAGLDLSVPAGVVCGFLGPNGAGKTTTMRLLAGLIHAGAGTIELLGQPFGRGDRRRSFEIGAIEELLELDGLRDRDRDYGKRPNHTAASPAPATTNASATAEK